MILGYVLFGFDTLAALAFIASFPVLCLTNNLPWACCLISTSLAAHFVIHHWYPQFSIGITHYNDDSEDIDDQDIDDDELM